MQTGTGSGAEFTGPKEALNTAHAYTRSHAYTRTHAQRNRKEFSAFKAGRMLGMVLFPLSSCSDKYKDQEG